MTILNGVERVLDFVAEGLTNIVGLLIGLFTFTVFLQVLTRFVVKIPLPWTEEVSRYLFIWMVFLGSAVGVRKGMHYCILFLTDCLPRFQKMVLEGIVHMAVIIFFYLILTRSVDFFSLMKTNKSPALTISMGIPYASVVVFGLFGFIFSVGDFFKFVSQVSHQQKNE